MEEEEAISKQKGHKEGAQEALTFPERPDAFYQFKNCVMKFKKLNKRSRK